MRLKFAYRGIKMKYENVSSPDFLVKAVTDEFLRGAKLIGKIEDSNYQQTEEGAGSIGGHFRHNLDFANAFLHGLKTGKIDYNRRERDLRVEKDRLYAIKRFALMICRLRNLPPDFFQIKVSVRSEIKASLWHESSAMRELEFLHSHTVHHHALIAERLSNAGIKVSRDFGVAPSTLQFWAEDKSTV